MILVKRHYPVYKELYLPRKNCLNKSCKVREELAQKDRDSGTEISGNTWDLSCLGSQNHISPLVQDSWGQKCSWPWATKQKSGQKCFIGCSSSMSWLGSFDRIPKSLAQINSVQFSPIMTKAAAADSGCPHFLYWSIEAGGTSRSIAVENPTKSMNSTFKNSAKSPNSISKLTAICCQLSKSVNKFSPEYNATWYAWHLNSWTKQYLTQYLYLLVSLMDRGAVNHLIKTFEQFKREDWWWTSNIGQPTL